MLQFNNTLSVAPACIGQGRAELQGFRVSVLQDPERSPRLHRAGKGRVAGFHVFKSKPKIEIPNYSFTPLLFSISPCLRVSVSPHLPLSPSPTLPLSHSKQPFPDKPSALPPGISLHRVNHQFSTHKQYVLRFCLNPELRKTRKPEPALQFDSQN